MRDEEDALGRDALAEPEIHEVAAQRLGGQHVERRERLVEQQHVGIDDEGAGEADALPHAAGQLLGIGRFEPVEADEIDRLEGAVAPLAARHALRLEAELDIAEHGEPREQGEALEHHGDAVRRAVHVLPAIEHLPAARLDEAGEDAQERRLARARLAEHRDDLAFLEAEIDVVENETAGAVGRLEGLVDRGGREQGVVHRFPLPLNRGADVRRRRRRGDARTAG